MEVLITGASGFLGWNLAQYLRETTNWAVRGTYQENPMPEGVDGPSVDLGDPDAIRCVLKLECPDVVIHTAAISGVGQCEADPKRAWAVNADCVSALVGVLDPRRTHLIYCSTDMVFDGFHAPYREGDRPRPSAVYAQTKARGERMALRYNGPVTLTRLALMFGDGPPAHTSFLSWLEAGLQLSTGVAMYEDEVRTALYVRDAAAGLTEIARRKATGVFHLGGPEPMNRADFARLYARVFDLNEDHVHAQTQAEAGHLARRPPNVSLDITEARHVLNFEPMRMNEALEDLRQRRANGNGSHPPQKPS